jgi:hypothetical protein
MTRFSALFFAAILPVSAIASDANVAGSDGTRSIGHLGCSAQDGQTLSDCPYEALPKEDGTLTLRILLPGGKVRYIYVKDGKPETTDSLGSMGSRRLANRTVVLITPSERFEIPNSVLDQ